MPPASLLPPDIADLLGRGGTVITGNQRAARTLRLTFDRQCRADGLASWQPPAIFAWDTWTADLYRERLLEGHATRMLLNHTQELQVWRSVIEADAQWASMQPVDALAAMAADGWQRLCAYRGQQRLRSLSVSGDTRNFQRWALGFARRSKADEYLTSAELEEALIAAGNLTVTPREVLLVGFDSKTPAQQALLDALRRSGSRFEEQAIGPAAKELFLAAAEDPGDELTRAALWTRGFLVTQPEAHPQATVAIIVPGLAAERREIDRVFRSILAPESEDITAMDASPYEFSVGQPLGSMPLVSIALEVLRLATAALPLDRITRLLLSPYFATRQGELAARAEFDAFDLRSASLLRPELDRDRLILLASASKRTSRLGGLLSQLRSLHRTKAKLFADAAPKQRPYAEWADAARELLQASGWPGAEPLDSTEFQTRQKFDSALDELATLDFEGVRPAFADAVARLEAILQRTLFAPESREAPIQILSPLEAAGSRFDAIYFLRGSDLTWPIRLAINPLLGWRLQRELGMPGSDAALDFATAKRTTERIAASAGTVVFSYAATTEDGPQRASSLLAGLRLQVLSATETPLAPATIELEVFDDGTFLPLTNFTVKGGAKILQLQAACGFRAFAERRLWSTAIESAEPGMDALERGNIVHEALEHLWNDLRTQAALRALTPEQRAAQLSRSIEYSLQRAAANLAADRSALPWDAAYLDLQRQRLKRLLGPWLDVELGREPFEVELREQQETATIGPLSFALRIDRVDRLVADKRGGEAEGGAVLLDYKTGVAKPSAWTGERPDEPQLPLYAVLREPGSLAAVAFANIRAGTGMALEGYSRRKGILPKLPKSQPPSLERQIEEWRHILNNLAEDYAAGDARVRPKSYPGTCKHCDQRLLCRVDAPTLVHDDEDDGDDGVEAEEAFEGVDG